MKNPNFKLLGFLMSILAAIMLSSCSSDDAESTTSTIRLAVNTTAADSRMASNLQFDSGSITIRELVFDGENGDVSVSRTKEQIATIDYATGNVTPEVVVTIPSGNYSDVNLGIELQDVNDTPTVVINGTYTNAKSEVIPVRFEFNSGEVFEANAVSVNIPEGANLIGKITFDANSWFSTVTNGQMDNATQTNGIIVISQTQNPAIFDVVANRLDVETNAVFE